jgi:NitT/TauT family transport system permease protein
MTDQLTGDAAMVAEIMPHQVDVTTHAPDVPTTTPRSKRRQWGNVFYPILGFAIFIGLWYLMHYWALEHIWGKPSFLITEPHRVIKESFFDSTNRSNMLKALYWTAVVALAGLIVAILVGMGLAILMAQSRAVELTAWPYLVALQAIPILALTPVIGNIFGFGLNSRVFVCVIIALFPIVSNTLFGLLSADRGQHDLFTLQGAGRWTRLWRLQLPAAMPAIFAGFRIAAGLSVIGAVVGELFFKRGDKGIGILLDNYRSRNNNPLMYGCLILAAALGIAVFLIFGWLGNLVVGRWHESTRKTG